MKSQEALHLRRFRAGRNHAGIESTVDGTFDEEDEIDKNNPKLAHLVKMIELLDRLWNDLQHPQREKLIDLLECLSTLAKEVKDSFSILLLSIELQAKIMRDLGDYARAVNVLKLSRLYCNIARVWGRKLYFYKLLVETLIQMRDYDTALVFAKKMLRLAWKVNDQDYEITAYDKIGLVFYYKG